MKTLIVNADGSLMFDDVPTPECGEMQALVKILACGMCNGTDGKLIHRNFKGENTYPLMLGHEAVGRVLRVGSKVRKYHPGDLVLLPYAGPTEKYYSAWGGFSEYGVVWDEGAYAEAGIVKGHPEFPVNCPGESVIPGDIDPVEAVMIITLREILSSIRYFGIQAGDRVAVFGCGPVGQTFIRFMHLLGVKQIFALEPIAEKRKAALEKGAAVALDNRGSDWKDVIRAQCPEGLDYVIDAVGVSAVINDGLELIRDRGKICCYGISPNLSANIDWSRAPYNWQLIFQQMPRKDEEHKAQAQILEWIRNGEVVLKDFISDVYDFDDALTAFARLEERKIAGKCVMRMREYPEDAL